MSDSFVLLHNRNMVLPIRTVLPWIFTIRVVTGIMASFFDEIFCCFEIFFFSSDSIEFYEPHLNNLVARRNVQLVLTKDRTNQVSILQCYVEEVSLSCSLVVSCRSFVEVSRIVKLVTQFALFFPALLARPRVCLIRIDGPRRIKISVGLLCISNLNDQRIDIIVHCFIRIEGH